MKHSKFQNACHMRHVLILYLFNSTISAHLLMHQLTAYVGLIAKYTVLFLLIYSLLVAYIAIFVPI